MLESKEREPSQAWTKVQQAHLVLSDELLIFSLPGLVLRNTFDHTDRTMHASLLPPGFRPVARSVLNFLSTSGYLQCCKKNHTVELPVCLCSTGDLQSFAADLHAPSRPRVQAAREETEEKAQQPQKETRTMQKEACKDDLKTSELGRSVRARF